MGVAKIVRDLAKPILLLVLLALTTSIAFSFVEGAGFAQSTYWAVVTMTTVGYGDVAPHTINGRITGMFLSTAGVVLYGYAVTAITSVAAKSSISEALGMKEIDYKDHFIVCGWGPESEVAFSELLITDRPVVVITEDQDEVPQINRKAGEKEATAIYGDPSKEEALEQAKASEARVILLCMEEDSKNIITALHAKKINPQARVVVKAERSELKETMKVAGVTYVSTPRRMGGRLIASAAFEPEVANFVEDVTSGTTPGGHDLRQYTISEEKSGPVKELSRKLKEKTGTNLLAVGKKEESGWNIIPNPSPDQDVSSGNIIILLGNEDQFKEVESFLETKQGRKTHR